MNMSKIQIELSPKYKKIIENNPEIIETLLSDYLELQQDKHTRLALENDQEDAQLFSSLKSVL
jgi:hypothetical protein